jgi:putative nucleotidyltransferase with HDIG domain
VPTPQPPLQARPSPRPLDWPPIIERLRALAAGAGAPLYLVGGTVRDAFLGRPLHDVDLVTPGDGVEIARGLADALGGAFYPLDAERRVGRVVLAAGEGERLLIDVARYRADTLEGDLRARDFTINAAAVDLAGDLQSVIDPLGGLGDLAAKHLRLCAPDAVANDPSRALRAVRQSVQFGLRMAPETSQAVRRDGQQLTRISAERLRDEFITILAGPRPAAALRVLDALNLLELIVPEIVPMRNLAQSPPHAATLWEHVLAVVDHLEMVLAVIAPTRDDNLAAQAGLAVVVSELRPFCDGLRAHLAKTWPDDRPMRALIMLAALLHDIGKPDTQTVDDDGHMHFFGHDQSGAAMAEARCQALRLSRAEGRRVARVVQHHMRPMMLANAEQVTPRAIYRFFRDAREAGVDVCLLSLADYLGTFGVTLDLEHWSGFARVVATLLDGYFQKFGEVVQPPTLLTGDDIKRELGIPQGPEIGRLLHALREAQAAGEVTSREAALAFVAHQQSVNHE